MASFDVDRDRILVFEIDDECVFSRFFDRTDVFEELREYYEDDAYRFEVPAEEFEAVRSYLEDNYYELEVVTDLEPYTVVIDQYEPHADILRNSVIEWTRSGHRFFLLKDELSVQEAIEQGADPVAETEFVIGL